MRRFFALLLALVALPALAATDINSASMEELERLPGIGPSKAAAIVQYRTDHGGFKTVDELDNVSGIGPSTLASIRDLVSVGGGKASTSGAASPSGAAPTPSAPPSDTPKASSSAAGCPVNINTADAGGLKHLPGIGDSKAAAIVQHRTDKGPFPSCDALDEVSGIGPSTLANLRDCCTVK